MIARKKMSNEKTALEYGETKSLEDIQFKLQEARARVKAAKSKLNEEEYELSFLKVAEQNRHYKRKNEKEFQPRSWPRGGLGRVICAECQDEFNPNDPSRIKLGGKRIHCSDCCQETVTKYLGLQAGDGKQTQVQILAFDSSNDREKYKKLLAKQFRPA